MTAQEAREPLAPTAEADTDAQARSADIAARIDRIPAGRFHLRLVGVIGSGTFFDGFDAVSLAVVLTAVMGTFGLGFSTAGLIVSAGFAGQFVGALVVGALSDRIGRRRAFVIALAVFGGMSLACALAWSEGSLLMFRALQGLGLGAEVPIAATLLNEYLGRRSRGRVAVLYQTLFPWGLFVAPLVALAAITTFGPHTGWRVLLAVGCLPLLLAVLAWFVLPESARWLASQGRYAEADAYVSRMEREALERGVVLEAPVPVAGVRMSKPRLAELFGPEYRGRTAMLAVLWFSASFVVWGYSTWLPSMYVAVGGLPQSSALVLTVILGAVTLCSTYFMAWIIDRVGRRPLLATAFGIAMLGGLFGSVTTGALGFTGWPVLFATGVILALGITAPSVALYLYTGELYPTRMRGWATSSLSSMSRLASIISPFVFGYFLDGHGGASAVFGVMAAFGALGAAVVAWRGIETRRRPLEELAR